MLLVRAKRREIIATAKIDQHAWSCDAKVHHWDEALASGEKACLVAGLAYFLLPNAKLFTEVVLIEGFEPLQFISGGIPGLDPTITSSDGSARSQAVVGGINVAF